MAHAPGHPVEIPWFANYEGAVKEIVHAQPYAATDVHAALERDDADFLGWARVNKPEGDNYPLQALTENDVWLKWDGTKYTVNGNTVTRIYSDGIAPDRALYAVWNVYAPETRIIDFSAPMVLATNADQIKGQTDNNGTFSINKDKKAV